MNELKVIARLFGGLGNQLFIYAAARRLALVNNAELVLDDVSGFIRDHQYQRFCQLDHFNIPCRKATPSERMEPFSRARRYFKRRWNALKPFEQRSYIKQDAIDFDQRLLSFRCSGQLHLEGYWQGEGYFKDFESQIRADLRIAPPTDDQNQQMARRIRTERAVAVHLRFFDDPFIVANAVHVANNASHSYYQRAIDAVEHYAPGVHYFVFTDRPEEARKRLPMAKSRMTLVKHNHGDAMAYADLWLMSQCQHFIIANSTFSWWGAWLAANSNKVVIAPKVEQRRGAVSWGFNGLIPNSWLKL